MADEQKTDQTAPQQSARAVLTPSERVLVRIQEIIDRRERGNMTQAEHDLNKYDQIVGLVRREAGK